ncbi:hypothetical protein B1R94_14440 [Mycolicibacterium litorale]|nr:hypothetical protein B1R94_14440 [Mycolicibacterium litorale]
MFNFRLFLASQVAAQAGTWLQFVAVAWLAGQSTGSGAALGGVAVATFGPLLVLGPWTGALADRFDKHVLLVGTQLLMAAQAMSLAVVVLAGFDGLTLIYPLTLAYGVILALEAPVRRAYVAEIVEHQDIPRAVSLTNVVAAVGRVIGPLCAGVLIGSAGIGWCFIVNALSYLIALAVLLATRRAELRRTAAQRRPGAALAGLRYAWRVSELRIPLALTAVVATFGFNHQVIVPLLAANTFHGGPGAFTLLYTAISLGAVLGALSVARRRDIDLRFLTTAVGAFAVANGLIAISPNLVTAVISGFAAGASALLFITAAGALLQQRCAPEMHGRVMALFTMMLFGGVPIGAPLVGAIADAAGPRVAVGVGTAAALCACAAALRHLNSPSTAPTTAATL